MSTSELITAMEEVLTISDRKHDAWDRAKAALADIKEAKPTRVVIHLHGGLVQQIISDQPCDIQFMVSDTDVEGTPYDELVEDLDGDDVYRTSPRTAEVMGEYVDHLFKVMEDL